MPEDARLSKRAREDYLIRLEKEFAFAGASIPEHVTIDGEDIRLRAFVFEIMKKKGGLTDDEQAQVDRVAALVRRKRSAIVREISSADISANEAENLYRTAIGLGRALDTLGRAHEPRSSVQDEARKAKIEDGRRWLGLVRRIYTKERRDRDGFQ
ncbi:MAG: hypothetical protein A4E28_03264 [Methanocella sp. PtaU1.Bin125]|nr:MAG: hypothetical protein A4E28_03264 [Methanocella sp. PtaU1.Bin125]